MINFSILAASAQTMEGEGVYNYALIVVLMMTGLYLILSKSNMVKSIIGLNLFQVSVIMFYVSMGRVDGGTAPILYKKDQHAEHHASLQRLTAEEELAMVNMAGGSNGHSHKGDDADSHTPTIKQGGKVYSNPLPHVLMLTAIVVGVATTALALSLVVRINEYYGTIEEDELEAKEAVND
jgi:multicomponent Na+:H+ antiporter subunit C